MKNFLPGAHNFVFIHIHFVLIYKQIEIDK